MGFRSTMISEDMPRKWADWFMDKYFFLVTRKKSILSTSFEIKLYTNDIFNDVQKSLNETGYFTGGTWEETRSFKIAVMSESGTISRVTIKKNEILYELADDFIVSDCVYQY